MFKKILSVSLTLAVTLSLAACGANTKSDAKSKVESALEDAANTFTKGSLTVEGDNEIYTNDWADIEIEVPTDEYDIIEAEADTEGALSSYEYVVKSNDGSAQMRLKIEELSEENSKYTMEDLLKLVTENYLGEGLAQKALSIAGNQITVKSFAGKGYHSISFNIEVPSIGNKYFVISCYKLENYLITVTAEATNNEDVQALIDLVQAMNS